MQKLRPKPNPSRDLESIWWLGKLVKIGDSGTYFGGLPGEEVKQVTGSVFKIREGNDFAVLGVRDSAGETHLLRL